MDCPYFYFNLLFLKKIRDIIPDAKLIIRYTEYGNLELTSRSRVTLLGREVGLFFFFFFFFWRKVFCILYRISSISLTLISS